jgi:GntR family transcriptional regulator
MRVPLSALDFRVHYQQIPAPEALAEVFGIESGTELLRREYESVDRGTDRREQWSVSYLVVSLIESNPDLMDASKEPWPGGTQHQLYTVGIELGRMETEVTAAMPTTVETQVWDIPEGVPMLLGHRVAYDTTGRVVEVSEARYPADRTTMSFSLTLKSWEAK